MGEGSKILLVGTYFWRFRAQNWLNTRYTSTLEITSIGESTLENEHAVLIRLDRTSTLLNTLNRGGGQNGKSKEAPIN